MSLEESEEYFKTKTFFVQFLHTFIDYNDIENPIRTSPAKLQAFSFQNGKQQNLEITMQSHEFTDFKSLLQLQSEGDVTEFMNVD